MNRIIHSILFLASIPVTLFSQTLKKDKVSESFIPMKIGNYWVYSSSNPSDKLDTIKITEKKTVELGTAYYINNQPWFEKNDSIYIFQSGRGGNEFPTLQYFPSEKGFTYNVVIGGDVMVQRTVTKINGLYTVNGKTYSNCYKYTHQISNAMETTIISKGVGIIEMKTPDKTQSLVEYKIQ